MVDRWTSQQKQVWSFVRCSPRGKEYWPTALLFLDALWMKALQKVGVSVLLEHVLVVTQQYPIGLTPIPITNNPNCNSYHSTLALHQAAWTAAWIKHSLINNQPIFNQPSMNQHFSIDPPFSTMSKRLTIHHGPRGHQPLSTNYDDL